MNIDPINGWQGQGDTPQRTEPQASGRQASVEAMPQSPISPYLTAAEAAAIDLRNDRRER